MSKVSVFWESRRPHLLSHVPLSTPVWPHWSDLFRLQKTNSNQAVKQERVIPASPNWWVQALCSKNSIGAVSLSPRVITIFLSFSIPLLSPTEGNLQWFLWLFWSLQAHSLVHFLCQLAGVAMLEAMTWTKPHPNWYVQIIYIFFL